MLISRLACNRGWLKASQQVHKDYMPIIVWNDTCILIIWAASSEFGTYHLCEQRRFGRACASAQSRQSLRCSLIQAMSQEESSERKPDPWPLWMAGHAQLKICHDGMLEDTNSLDGAHFVSMPILCWFAKTDAQQSQPRSCQCICKILWNSIYLFVRSQNFERKQNSDSNQRP